MRNLKLKVALKWSVIPVVLTFGIVWLLDSNNYYISILSHLEIIIPINLIFIGLAHFGYKKKNGNTITFVDALIIGLFIIGIVLFFPFIMLIIIYAVLNSWHVIHRQLLDLIIFPLLAFGINTIFLFILIGFEAIFKFFRKPDSQNLDKNISSGLKTINNEVNDKNADPENRIDYDETKTGIRVHLKFFPLAFVLNAITPIVEIDGVKQQKKWGKHFIQTSPGRHFVRIYFPYMGKKECGANHIQLSINNNETKSLSFYMPPWMFVKGKIKLLGSKTNPSGNTTEYKTREISDESKRDLALFIFKQLDKFGDYSNLAKDAIYASTNWKTEDIDTALNTIAYGNTSIEDRLKQRAKAVLNLEEERPAFEESEIYKSLKEILPNGNPYAFMKLKENHGNSIELINELCNFINNPEEVVVDKADAVQVLGMLDIPVVLKPKVIKTLKMAMDVANRQSKDDMHPVKVEVNEAMRKIQ